MANGSDLIIDPKKHDRIMRLRVQEPFGWPEEPGVATVEDGILEEDVFCILSYLPICLTQCKSSSLFRYTGRVILVCLSFSVAVESYFTGVGHVFVYHPLKFKG